MSSCRRDGISLMQKQHFLDNPTAALFSLAHVMNNIQKKLVIYIPLQYNKKAA